MNSDIENRYSAIIFDMDNTILSSKIDFKKMKHQLKVLLTNNQIDTSNLDSHITAAELIAMGKLKSPQLEKKMWDIVRECESEGMQGAVLEPGAFDVISHLSKTKTLFVLTNNSSNSAQEALKNNHIYNFFCQVFGRDDVPYLKPSVDAVNCILEKYNQIPSDQWVMIGDAWIDGKAAVDAGIDFIAYNSDAQVLAKKNIQPVMHIKKLVELKPLA
ncbi:phosphoglycolate phosphatase [Desulfitispora alkaliphila]|uniref:HAD family hydrolase n=1 Tax=Desulfitispora alkaliphila TaxID=622674 RepID=UPI003D1F42A1